MTKLLLIRHGETDDNLKRRYCGFGDPPLNATGVLQAERLVMQLKEFDVEAVYSSDLLRAVQTAKTVFPNHQIKTMQDFRELNFGIFEGLNYHEIMERYPGLYRDWIRDPSGATIPNGEEFGEFRKRVGRALSSIIFSNRNKTIVLVTHGGPIRLILCEALGYGLEKSWEVSHENAAFSIIDISNKSAHLSAFAQNQCLNTGMPAGEKPARFRRSEAQAGFSGITASEAVGTPLTNKGIT